MNQPNYKGRDLEVLQKSVALEHALGSIPSHLSIAGGPPCRAPPMEQCCPTESLSEAGSPHPSTRQLISTI